MTINSSYMLQINKRYLTQRMLVNKQSSQLEIDQLSQIKTFSYQIFLQYTSTSIVSLLSTNNQHNIRPKLSLPEQLGSINKLPSIKSNTILFNSLNQTNSPTIIIPVQENYIQKLQRQKRQQQNKFQNSKLNQDYDLIRNKITLSNLQSKRSGQLFKIFQTKYQLHKKEDQNYQINSIINNQKNQILTEQQRMTNNEDKLMKTPPILTPNQAIDQSIIIQSYRHQHTGKQPHNSNINNKQPSKANYRSIQMLVLAIIAAVCVSLGANLRVLIFGQ